METAAETTDPLASLRRALALLETVDAPEDVGVRMSAAIGSIPPTVRLFPRSHADHEAIFRRLNLHGWNRIDGDNFDTVMADGVEVILYDVRAGL